MKWAIIRNRTDKNGVYTLQVVVQLLLRTKRCKRVVQVVVACMVTHNRAHVTRRAKSDRDAMVSVTWSMGSKRHIKQEYEGGAVEKGKSKKIYTIVI